jgi:hypothetical protein
MTGRFGLTVALAAAFAAAALAAPARAETAAARLAVPNGLSERQSYIDVVRREASVRGLPPEVAEAVAYVESGFEPDAVGAVGEIGLMQIRPSTAEMLGHDGGALALFDPATNARFAVRYLATAWKLANGDLCRALMKYRAGHRSETMSSLSANYCLRAKAYLARLGSPLADGVAPEIVAIKEIDGDQPKVTRRKPGPYLGWRPGRHTAGDNARFWAAHEARIRAIEARIERRWKIRTARRN